MLLASIGWLKSTVTFDRIRPARNSPITGILSISHHLRFWWMTFTFNAPPQRHRERRNCQNGAARLAIVASRGLRSSRPTWPAHGTRFHSCCHGWENRSKAAEGPSSFFDRSCIARLRSGCSASHPRRKREKLSDVTARPSSSLAAETKGWPGNLASSEIKAARRGPLRARISVTQAWWNKTEHSVVYRMRGGSPLRRQPLALSHHHRSVASDPNRCGRVHDQQRIGISQRNWRHGR